MPQWIDTLNEIKSRNNETDGLRRERIKVVESITKRPLVIYATDFLNPEKVQACRGEVSIDPNDKLGFAEVIQNISGDCIDILVHSPGGTAEAAEAIISLVRGKFSSVHFFVPDQAKSAATMLCCAGDKVFMDYKSELGPIDPQIRLIRADGIPISVPAQSVLEQFNKAKDSIANSPKSMPAWIPILQTLAPSLLTICEDADKLSRSLVENWLCQYMLKDVEEKEKVAKDIADFLASSKTHLSHGRRIGIEQLIERNFRVANLNDQPDLQSAIWNLYLSIRWTFEMTGAFKIIENGDGDAFIRVLQVQQIKLPVQMPVPQGLK